MAFFLSGLPRRSEMVKSAGKGNYRRIINHLPVGRYRPVQRPLFLFRDEKEERGEEALSIARPGWLPTRFAGACFLPSTGSLVHAVRPPARPTPLVLLPVLDAIGGTGLRGLDSRDC